MLTECVKTWEGPALLSLVAELWSALRTEIMTSKESRVVEAALRTVTNVCTALIPVNIASWDRGNALPPALDQFLDPLLAHCSHELRNPDSKVAMLVGKILQRVGVLEQ